MRYVHVASAHHRELPECVQLAAQGIGDPDRRVLAMLGARGSYVAAETDERKESGSQPDLEVRAGGLEPPRSYPSVPKTDASTNFATLAGSAV